MLHVTQTWCIRLYQYSCWQRSGGSGNAGNICRSKLHDVQVDQVVPLDVLSNQIGRTVSNVQEGTDWIGHCCVFQTSNLDAKSDPVLDLSQVRMTEQMNLCRV